jgi:hypothetical protein
MSRPGSTVALSELDAGSSDCPSVAREFPEILNLEAPSRDVHIDS